jgi:intracellular septation protein
VAVETLNWRRRHFPFSAAQTVNILGEIGPLVAMFLVNGIYGIAAGTWALILSTILSLIVTLWVLGRPPIMPFIAGAVSIAFGTLTLVTGNAMWVQIKVTLFNTLVALLLWVGLRSGKSFFRFVFGSTFHYTD